MGKGGKAREPSSRVEERKKRRGRRGEEKEGEEEEKKEEVGKCKPNVGPGYSQEKQTLLQEPCSRLPFRGQEGLGQMLEKRKRKKGEEEIRKKKKKTGMKSTAWGQGPASPSRLLLCQGLSCSGELACGSRVCLSCMCSNECVFHSQGSWGEAQQPWGGQTVPSESVCLSTDVLEGSGMGSLHPSAIRSRS